MQKCSKTEPIQNSRRQNRDMKQVLDEGPHILDAIIKNFDATATRRKVFVHSWFVLQTFSLFFYLYSPFKDGQAVQKIRPSNGMMIVKDKLNLRGWKDIIFQHLPGSEESCRDSKLCLQVTVRSVSTWAVVSRLTFCCYPYSPTNTANKISLR